MIPAQIIRRVFRLQYAGKQGTAFAVDVDNRQYLVSAKHILGAAEGSFSIDLYHENGWKQLPVKLTGHSADSDISIVAAETRLIPPDLNAEASSEDMIYGQTVYFLGFPYGLFGNFPTVNNGFPLPFVKAATLSMIHGPSEKMLYLDGINNVGFSGGPVAFQAGNTRDWRIAGVISGYVAAEETISLKNADTGLRYSANTGLIKAAPIDDAVSVITANPNGFEKESAG